MSRTTSPTRPVRHSRHRFRPALLRVLAGALAGVVGASLLVTAPAVAARDAGSRGVVTSPGSITGYGFDTCAAPSQRVMDRWWRGSPFAAVGIYVSGSTRACAQENLTRRWVSTQDRRGWRLLPIHVGLQAPCTTAVKDTMSSNRATARKQGRFNGNAMVRNARRLGIASPSVLYLDIEYYDIRRFRCNQATLSFMSAWTRAVRRAGYRSGVYSSASAAIDALATANRNGRDDLAMPDHLWLAWGNGAADVDGGEWLGDRGWQPHRRVKQYILDRTARFGGVAMNIDYDYLDVGNGTTATKQTGRCGTVFNFPVYRTLAPGHRGPQSTVLRCLLRRETGYDGTVGRRFGPDAQLALERYQRRMDIAVTGTPTRRTWTALFAAGKHPTMKFGHATRRTYWLQRALTAALGRRVPKSGKYGQPTVDAVVEYRRRLETRVSSVTTPWLWRQLAAGRIGVQGTLPASSLPPSTVDPLLPSCATCADPDADATPARH